MCWCFATVNNRLAEIYFKRKKNGHIKIWAHCYVKKEEFKTKQEQRQIAKDTKNLKIVWKKKKYYLRPGRKKKAKEAVMKLLTRTYFEPWEKIHRERTAADVGRS